MSEDPHKYCRSGCHSGCLYNADEPPHSLSYSTGSRQLRRYALKPMRIPNRARRLVCDMNPREAKKFQMENAPISVWPKWAQQDYQLACDALQEMEDSISENTEHGRDCAE